MIGLWKLSAKKNSGLIAIYVLYSLKKQPKSGYDILSEIRDKCGHGWSPSKGTLYPLLKKLERENLIRIKKVGMRSKNIYGITPTGNKFLSDFRKEKEMLRERFFQFQKLFSNILGEEKTNILHYVLKIREIALKKNNKKAVEELKICLGKLSKI
jgi:DNA-binding PadR family transcriptional regulator